MGQNIYFCSYKILIVTYHEKDRKASVCHVHIMGLGFLLFIILWK